jgi:excisionase family DNA binding protein
MSDNSLKPNVNTSEPLLIDIRELSRLTGISIGTLYHWAAASKIPCVRLSKRALKFRRDSILEWIERLSQSERTDDWESPAPNRRKSI